MKILVTGNQGYIGTVLVERLLTDGHSVTGLDIGFFEDCALEPAMQAFNQINKDIRDVNRDDLRDIEAIIHLAALSNDPLGEFSPSLTEEINYKATIGLANLAKSVGVQRFVYASSQSMYGISTSEDELDEDSSEKNPITAYAKTKWSAEQDLKQLGADTFTVVCFRPSTVFGASSRLRCDIVFNNLVACAYTTGKIEIKSDGTPWRPVVHIDDVCSAFIAGLQAPTSLVTGRSYNVGILDGNFSVRQLAEAAGRAVPGSAVVFTGQHGSDARSYRVSFKRILTELAEWYKPEWDLDRGGRQLVKFFDRVKFGEKEFRGAQTNRLLKLRSLDQQGLLHSDLRIRAL
jgi:nucleoside-diphosphate-sugar epimerase